MKRLVAALAFVCLAVSARAQGPACVQVTDTLYTVGVSLPGLMTGQIDLSLGYSAVDGPVIIPQSGARQTISGGALSTCLVPGNYAAGYSVRRSAPQTGHTSFTRYWVIPSTGGPYTVAQIETATPPTPPFYALSATAPLTYYAG